MGYFDEITRPAWADNHPAVMASVTPLESLSAPTRRVNRDTDDQVDLKGWYKNCGPVRVAVNTPAATVSQMEIVIEQDKGAGYQPVNDPRFQTIMRHFRGRDRSQQELLRSIAVALRVPAEGYLVMVTEGDRLHYRMVQTANMKAVNGQPGWSEYFTSKGARQGDRGHHMTPNRFVYHFHHPCPEFPDDAWSPLMVGAESIIRFKKAYRHISRTLDSKLAMNNILWAKATTGGSDWQKKVWDWAYEAAENDDGIQSIAPLMMSTVEEPKMIETGSTVHGEQLEIAQDAMGQFARDVDFPTSWMVDGPGQAKYDNEIETYEWYLDNTAASLAEEVADIATRTHLRPILSATALGEGLNPEQFRVRLSDAAMRSNGDRDHDIVRLYELGLIDRKAFARLCGLAPDDVMRLPDGIQDYEHWLASQNPGVATSEFGVAGIHRPNPADTLDAELVPDGFTTAEIIDATSRPAPVLAELAKPSWDSLV